MYKTWAIEFYRSDEQSRMYPGQFLKQSFNILQYSNPKLSKSQEHTACRKPFGLSRLNIPIVLNRIPAKNMWTERDKNQFVLKETRVARN